MNLREKIVEANRVLADAVGPRTAMLCSFGKDSMVMLHLAARHKLKTVLWLDDMDEVTDFDFISHVCDRYQLDVVPLHPGRATFMILNDQPLFLSFMFVTENVTTCVPTNMVPVIGDAEPYMCVDEELRAARGKTQTTTPVDRLVSGFKLSDVQSKGCMTFVNTLSESAQQAHVDRLASMGTHTELTPGLPLFQPLLHWTDDDVWRFIDLYDVPWSPKVYERTAAGGGVRQPHGRAWCFRCHDPREASIVSCPKSGQRLLNFAAMTHDTDLRLEMLRRTGVLHAGEYRELAHG